MEYAGVVVFHAIDRKEQPQHGHGHGHGQGIGVFGFMRYDPFDKYQRYQNNKDFKTQDRLQTAPQPQSMQLQLTAFLQNVLAGKTGTSKSMHNHRYMRLMTSSKQ
jgi:hypothetical protein